MAGETGPPSGEEAERGSVEVLAQTDGVRVSLQRLGESERTPWHTHSQVSDTLICAMGRMSIELRDPTETFVLRPGEMFVVARGRAHQVSPAGADSCVYVNVQQGGTYDFIQV